MHFYVFLSMPVLSATDSHLAFAAQPSKQLVALELGFLIGHNARHLEDEPGWPWLFVQTHSVEW